MPHTTDPTIKEFRRLFVTEELQEDGINDIVHRKLYGDAYPAEQWLLKKLQAEYTQGLKDAPTVDEAVARERARVAKLVATFQRKYGSQYEWSTVSSPLQDLLAELTDSN